MTQKEDAQLAEMNFALQAPLARREFASKLFFLYSSYYNYRSSFTSLITDVLPGSLKVTL